MGDGHTLLKGPPALADERIEVPNEDLASTISDVLNTAQGNTGVVTVNYAYGDGESETSVIRIKPTIRGTAVSVTPSSSTLTPSLDD